MDDLAQQVADKAARAVSQLKDRSKNSLDYSETSLAVIEAMLVEASDYVNEMRDDEIDTLVQLVGSYVLEVGRHEFGGRYLWHEGRAQPALVVGEPSYTITLLAFDKIRGRMSGDEGDSIPFFYEGFATRARQAEPGTSVLYN